MLIAELVSTWKLLIKVHIAAVKLCLFVHLIHQSDNEVNARIKQCINSLTFILL